MSLLTQPPLLAVVSRVSCPHCRLILSRNKPLRCFDVTLPLGAAAWLVRILYWYPPSCPRRVSSCLYFVGDEFGTYYDIHSGHSLRMASAILQPCNLSGRLKRDRARPPLLTLQSTAPLSGFILTEGSHCITSKLSDGRKHARNNTRPRFILSCMTSSRTIDRLSSVCYHHHRSERWMGSLPSALLSERQAYALCGMPVDLV